MSKNLQNTMLYKSEEFENEKVKIVLEHVKESLDEKGYNSINQIVGYLISNDPAYISSYKDSRKIIQRISRDEIIEELVRVYLYNATRDKKDV